MENMPISAETASMVVKNNISGIDLLCFDAHDLKQLGIKSTDAKKLHSEINQLRKLQDSDRMKHQ